jgi:surfactin synthase thioesterase subunit
MSMATTAWVRRFREPSATGTARLVCFPHAGGTASYFHPVSRLVPPHLEVLAIQYPGRHERRREPCIEHIGTLADRITEALLPWTDRPFAFFGHSMGATIAFEVTRRLEAKGVSPTVLFVSGRRAPSRARHETLHLEGDQALIAELRRLGGTEAGVLADPELLALVMPAIRGDYTAIMTYRCAPGAVVAAPLHVLVGDSDPHVTLDEAMSWKEHTGGRFELAVFTGGHFYLNDHVAAVVRTIVDNTPFGA